MKKISIVLAVFLVLAIVLTACSTSSGLLLREAFVNYSALKSFESETSLAITMKNGAEELAFGSDIYTKVVDLNNSEIHFTLDPAIFAFLGLASPESADIEKKAALKLLIKDGEMFLTSNQDKVGISLGNFYEMLGTGLEEEGTAEQQAQLQEEQAQLQEEQEKAVENLQKFIKGYLQNYEFTLQNLSNKGLVNIALPNGSSVTTEHIQIELGYDELIQMLEYSLKHANAHPELFDYVAEYEEDIQGEIDQMLIDLQGMKEELANDSEAQELMNSFKLKVNAYVNPVDKQIYQLNLNVNFKLPSMEEFDPEDFTAEELEQPMLPLMMMGGYDFSISIDHKIWNHNQALSPVAIPATTYHIDDLEDEEKYQEFVTEAGEDSYLVQLMELFTGFFGGFDESEGEYYSNYMDLYLDQQKVETKDFEQELYLYQTKDKRLMVPFAFVIRQMGGEAEWDNVNRKVYAYIEGQEIIIDFKNKYKVTIDGEEKPNVLIELKDGLSYVDIEKLVEELYWFGFWDEETGSYYFSN